ncbi:MAG TPA: hypothetical protein VEY91_06795 [Candidatus Limnocylindria bacterium]|nr:hypothetical protein [Candidatus Limnocylindria bacterium]
MRLALRSAPWRGIALGLALSALEPAVASGFPAPELVGDFGRTLGVLGAPDEGGFSLALAALWPAHSRARFGVMAFADDLGSRIGRLEDPNDGTDLGAVETIHRWTYGGGWRIDVGFPGRWGWDPFASGTWGAYRLEDDHRGEVSRALSSIGFSLGAGVVRPVSGRAALGVGVRYHRVFNDVAGRYLSVAAQWRWGGSRGE